ncbi:hypothetical protein [Spiroplasma endosymbiont of Asaphidion curtum]|uniref:hypothetical protein n=1 Tax=Spiroplasma endosymbiont of Asaphidion curtum TaxID=3066281 RepID=UPI00313CDF8D
MKIEQTRMERFSLSREQINREIELDQALLQEEELLQDYISRFSHIDKEYFQEFLDNINQEWDLLSPQLHQDHSKGFINFEVRYEINQYLTDIRSKYDCDLNDNVNLQQILQDHNYHHKFGQHLNGTSESKYQEIILALENSVKNLQTKISSETELVQQVIKTYQEDLKKHPEALIPSKKPLVELLSNSAAMTDEQFNQLVTRFKKQKISFKWLVLLIIGSIILIISLLIVLLLLLIQ